jgi:HAD superfamily hydrolase (TIGR01549 family)
MVDAAVEDTVERTVDTVIFDLDGTVVDSHQFTFDAFRYAVAPCGAVPSDAEIHAAFGPSEQVILERFVPPDAVDAAYDRLQSFYRLQAHRARPHPDMYAVLDRLGQLGVCRCLFTGRGGDSTRMLLQTHDLEPRFEAVVTGDSPCEPKPSGQGIALLLSQVGASAQRALMVGDSLLDLQAAAAAGVAAVGVSWFTPVSFSGIRSDTLTTPTQLLERMGAAPPRAGSG